MKKTVLTLLKYLLFLGLGIFLVWWSIHRMEEDDWDKCKTALKSARYVLFIPVFFILVASHLSRAMRWKILMKPMGYNPSLANTFFAVMVGYLANLALPRLGEVLKCTILGRYEKVPADKLVGTILVERAVDVVSLLIIFIIAIVTQASVIGDLAREKMKGYFSTIDKQGLVIRLAILVVVLVLIFFLLRYIFKKYSEVGFIKKINILFKGVGAGLNSVRKLQNKSMFIFHSIFIWACYAFSTYIGFFVIKETSVLPFASTFPVLSFGSIGMIITPGGIGMYQLLLAEVMVLYGVDDGSAYANGMLQWGAQFFIILLVGFISLLILPYYNRHSDKMTAPRPQDIKT